MDDDLEGLSTHFDPVWRDQMWGASALDPRARQQGPDGEPFDIPMQGLGLFSCRKAAWPGFHPGFRGFGGEEGYIHEKFRRLGRRCVCLPWLRWIHCFGRPAGAPYPLRLRDRITNYLIGHREVGLDEVPVLEDFRAIATEAEMVLAVRYLSGVGRVEDWGCGMAYFKRFVPAGYYWGIDHDPSAACDQAADLASYASTTDGLFLRHVLEHDLHGEASCITPWRRSAAAWSW